MKVGKLGKLKWLSWWRVSYCAAVKSFHNDNYSKKYFVSLNLFRFVQIKIGKHASWQTGKFGVAELVESQLLQ